MESNPNKLNAIIIGSTGATGRELLRIMLKSDKWATITIVVRRKLPEWDEIDPNRLIIILKENLDILAENDLTPYFPNKYDTVFCCLGSRVGKGKEEFEKVDYTYVINSAEICEKLSIPHYSVVSSKGADSKSFFYYFKTKGKADDEVMKKNVDNISIYRPGALLERDNDCRFGEKVLKYIPFIPKIKCDDLMRVVIDDAEHIHLQKRSGKLIIEHSDIVERLRRLH